MQGHIRYLKWEPPVEIWGKEAWGRDATMPPPLNVFWNSSLKVGTGVGLRLSSLDEVVALADWVSVGRRIFTPLCFGPDVFESEL